MGKRANNTAAKAPAKKSKVDPAFASVGDAIMESDQLPERVRTMLVEMLPFSLKFASDERHELQSMAVGMVEQTMHGKKAALDAAATAEATALATLKASESNLGSAVTTAEAALAAQKAVVESRKTALVEATSAESSSGKTFAGLKTERTAALEAAEVMQKEKTAIEAAFAEHFGPMEEGEGKAHLKKLEPFLKKIEIEGTLLQALPSSVAKAKDKRGTFDHLVLQELSKAFNVKIAALAASVEAEGPAAQQRDVAVAAAEKDHDAKKTDLTQAAAEFEAAEKEDAAREEALSQAKQAVDDFQPQVDDVTERLSNAQKALEEFTAGPLANFFVFQARIAAVPEEAAPAEEAAAPVEEAVEAPVEASAA